MPPSISLPQASILYGSESKAKQSKAKQSKATEPIHQYRITHKVTMSSSNQFNILGSARLNTADGKNPPVSGSSTVESRGSAAGQPNTAEYKKQCKSAHDAMEDRLREEERLARTFRILESSLSILD